MKSPEGWRLEKTHKKPQATRKEGLENPGRREALRKIVGATTAGAVGAGSGWVGYAARRMFKGTPSTEEHQPQKDLTNEAMQTESIPVASNTREVSEAPRPRGVSEVLDEAEYENALESYTFLNIESHPENVPTGLLAGKKFAALYASYLGTPDGATVPEVLRIDFKANLSALWREKFGFDKSTRSKGEEGFFRKDFLKKHKNLMDLAERMCSSYERKNARRMSLDSYVDEIEKVTNSSREKFMGAMVALRGDSDFPQPRRALIEKMVNRIGAKTLLACSLTELMPSADGKTNTEMLDFILRNAGTDFLDRIPSVHDLLPSFGPYQITPALFGPDGAGRLSEKMEAQLPAGFLPQHVGDVSGKDHHKVAYIIATEHIIQFAARLKEHDTMHAGDLFNHTSLSLLHKEVVAFTATSHHQPAAAYSAFNSFIEHAHNSSSHTHMSEDFLHHIHDKNLRKYAHKALANYVFLSKPDAVSSISNEEL